jgi:hypothetical protein
MTNPRQAQAQLGAVGLYRCARADQIAISKGAIDASNSWPVLTSSANQLTWNKARNRGWKGSCFT